MIITSLGVQWACCHHTGFLVFAKQPIIVAIIVHLTWGDWLCHFGLDLIEVPKVFL